MPALLGRQLTDTERELRAVLARIPTDRLRRSTPYFDAGVAGSRNEVYAAALSLVDVPVRAEWQRHLCAHLIEKPEFLAYLARPGQFSEGDLLRICRALMEIDKMLDVKLAHAVRLLDCRGHGPDSEAIVRLLGVLDRISPGRRVVMSLFHLTREACPAATSKVALFLGKRGQDPAWMDRQMESTNPRVRANTIESLWGAKNSHARTMLRAALLDQHNRVVGNALFGLHLLGDPSVPGTARKILRCADPRFRATAAWVMGRIAKPEFRNDLTAALGDEDENVRSSAIRALAFLRPPEPRDSEAAMADPHKASARIAKTAADSEPPVLAEQPDARNPAPEEAASFDEPEVGDPGGDSDSLAPSRRFIPLAQR